MEVSFCFHRHVVKPLTALYIIAAMIESYNTLEYSRLYAVSEVNQQDLYLKKKMARSPSDLQLLLFMQHTEKDGTAHLLQSIHSQGVVTLLPLTDRSCFFLLLNYFSDSHMWDLCSLASLAM